MTIGRARTEGAIGELVMRDWRTSVHLDGDAGRYFARGIKRSGGWAPVLWAD